MKTSFGIRLIFSGLLLISIIFFPFFVSLIIALAGMFFISYYWEAIVLFFLSDLIYGIKGENFMNVYFGGFVLMIFFILLIEYLKKKLKFYKK